MSIRITKADLLADGWVESEETPIIILEKEIENQNPLSEADTLKLVLHRLSNELAFGILLPEGGILTFVANTMQELQDFEKRIVSYEEPF